MGVDDIRSYTLDRPRGTGNLTGDAGSHFGSDDNHFLGEVNYASPEVDIGLGEGVLLGEPLLRSKDASPNSPHVLLSRPKGPQ